MIYCNDIDLLHWEPNLFRDAAFASQLLMAGTGNLAGTAFTISTGSLADNHVSANDVIVLTGAVSGSYPIVSIDSPTGLTLSVLYDALFQAGQSPQPSPVGTASSLAFAVRTFGPQRKVVSDLISRTGGIEPDNAGAGAILNPSLLRRPCVLGTLQMIYNALAAASTKPADLTARADLYERLYRRALHQCRIDIDLDGDGKADTSRHLGVLAVARN